MSGKNPDRKNSKDPSLKHLKLDVNNVVSSTDFTGLIPANPQLEEELESYKEVHNFGNDIIKEEDRPEK
jgi:hypothetical protein